MSDEAIRRRVMARPAILYSSGGRYPVGSWHCDHCQSGPGEQTLAGADFDRVVQAAVAHLQQTGHKVSVMRGSREDLSPMHTQARP